MIANIEMAPKPNSSQLDGSAKPHPCPEPKCSIAGRRATIIVCASRQITNHPQLTATMDVMYECVLEYAI